MSEREPIVDVVEADVNLRKVIDELRQRKFLSDGIFDQASYIRDTDRIEAAWRKEKLLMTLRRRSSGDRMTAAPAP